MDNKNRPKSIKVFTNLEKKVKLNSTNLNVRKNKEAINVVSSISKKQSSQLNSHNKFNK